MNEDSNLLLPVMRTIRQTAKMGILPEWALRDMVKRGDIPCVHSGNRAYINVRTLCDMLAKLSQ